MLIIACAFISHRLSILRIPSIFQCLFTLWVSGDKVLPQRKHAIHLEMAKANLGEYFKGNYLSPQASVENPRQSLSATTSLSSITSSPCSGSPQKNFTARFQRKRTPKDELTEFWNLPQEDFDTCDPLQWWHGRRAQFPQLYRLVRDIFSIPGNYLYFSTSLLIIKLIYHLSLGSAVAVERIFSGGRDTISLRRASLKPETIRRRLPLNFVSPQNYPYNLLSPSVTSF